MSDGSYLDIYSVKNGKPVQLGQNRRDMIEARLSGHKACEGILNKLEADQVGNRCASDAQLQPLCSAALVPNDPGGMKARSGKPCAVIG